MRAEVLGWRGEDVGDSSTSELFRRNAERLCARNEGLGQCVGEMEGELHAGSLANGRGGPAVLSLNLEESQKRS